MSGRAPERVWYASYGSNMRRARLAAYLAGGRPAGAARTYPGCRDPRPPAASVLLRLAGTLYFATESEVWTGGRAFYDPAARGPYGHRPQDGEGPGVAGAAADDFARVPAVPGGAGAAGQVLVRAHLITTGQFADVVAQEMGRAPGTGPGLGPALADALATGRARLGGGHYETLVHPGSHGGVPVVTFTAPWGVRDVAANPPSAPYLTHLAAGLVEAGAGDARTVARYLARWPGAAGHWRIEAVARLAAADGAVALAGEPAMIRTRGPGGGRVAGRPGTVS
ncbi:histone deacetylase [Streptomyces sp. NPDC047002]|uniref:histone deacetylase n=1 Tax=Streptomyces sp. NPDC047002 TaxID=3155475 RepID=UPI003456CD85